MTKETLKRAMELDRAIDNAKNWLGEIQGAEEIFKEERQKQTGYYNLTVKTESGTHKTIQITADTAVEAIDNAEKEICKEIERMRNIFKELH